MLSYLHSFHAGCLADVHKHGLLSLLLSKLCEKERPISYMETHAGRGLYDLQSKESDITKEAEQGILALRESLLTRFGYDHPYLKTLTWCEQNYGHMMYPGSPLIAHHILRANDHLHFMELHPQEIKYLKRTMKHKNCHVHFRDGYEGVLAISPPNARRGVVLIDPSFEVKQEYETCVSFMAKLHKKWPEASIVLWYPLLRSEHYKPMLDKLEALDFPKYQHYQWMFSRSVESDHKNQNEKGMKGTGLFIVNCPWGVEDEFLKFHNSVKELL